MLSKNICVGVCNISVRLKLPSSGWFPNFHVNEPSKQFHDKKNFFFFWVPVRNKFQKRKKRHLHTVDCYIVLNNRREYITKRERWNKSWNSRQHLSIKNRRCKVGEYIVNWWLKAQHVVIGFKRMAFSNKFIGRKFFSINFPSTRIAWTRR